MSLQWIKIIRNNFAFGEKMTTDLKPDVPFCSDENDNETMRPTCRFFDFKLKNNGCKTGSLCPFAHIVHVCPHFVSSACSRVACKYAHLSRREIDCLVEKQDVEIVCGSGKVFELCSTLGCKQLVFDNQQQCIHCRSRVRYFAIKSIK